MNVELVATGIDEPAGPLVAMALERRYDTLIGCTSQNEHGDEHNDQPDRPPQT